MRGPVGADTGELVELAAAVGSDRRALERATQDVASALAQLRSSSATSAVAGLGWTLVRLDGACLGVELLAAEVRRTADALAAADAWVCRELTWATRPVELFRRMDDLGLEDVPGLGWIEELPAPDLRDAASHVWDVTRAVDLARGARLDTVLRGVRSATAVRVVQLTAVAARLAGDRAVAIGARVRDIGELPLVRGLRAGGGARALRALGVAGAGLGMGVAALDAVDEFGRGDAAAGWRSVAEVAGGALMLAPTPATVAVGVVVVAGVAVYENREAIADGARSGWRATTRAADAAASATTDAARRAVGVVREATDTVGGVVDEAVGTLLDTASDVLGGARALVDGLF